jgi:glyoxylase-like metal-dependent hydrolase (beta-lactamase superfamily II)
MRIMTFETGLYAVNTSIVDCGNGKAYIVDPGAEADRIVQKLSDENLKLEACLLTHGHFDHIGAIADLESRLGVFPVYIHPGDFGAFGHPFNQMPPEYPPAKTPSDMRDCRLFEAAKVIETPGHTPGGVCYLFEEEKTLFSGDTLFAGSIGRTDFVGGSMTALVESLTKLKELADDIKVIPGHGAFTTIADEKCCNPYL